MFKKIQNQNIGHVLKIIVEFDKKILDLILTNITKLFCEQYYDKNLTSIQVQ